MFRGNSLPLSSGSQKQSGLYDVTLQKICKLIKSSFRRRSRIFVFVSTYQLRHEKANRQDIPNSGDLLTLKPHLWVLLGNLNNFCTLLRHFKNDYTFQLRLLF